MSFDLVHDAQTVYRALVTAFSFPLRSVNIADPASRVIARTIEPALGAVALTLLDAETTFSAASPAELAELVEMTGARSRSAEPAFLVVTGDERDWVTAFEQAILGTLVDPHRGATVLACLPSDAPTQAWTASGPGFEGPCSIALPWSPQWVVARNEACKEFPLGVDLIWVQGDTVTALPRTTRLRREV